MKRRSALGALAAVCAFWAAAVVREFGGPIKDDFESFLAEYQSWLLGQRLTLFPLPKLALSGDIVLYPFGTNFALQSFCIERDLFKTALSVFGHGPWLQLYAVASFAVATFGVYFVLEKELGAARAMAGAVLANAFNFYAGLKYPSHLNLAIIHWTTIGIAVDFVLLKRAAEGRALGLNWLGLRGLLLLLGLGLELGSHAGVGITSALFTFVALVVRWRSLKVRSGEERRPVLAALGGAMVLVAWLYGALVFSLVSQTREYDFTGVGAGLWWSHPLRLLFPYLPGFNPVEPRWLSIFGDLSETGFPSGSPGLALVLVGAYGAFRARCEWKTWLPLALCLLLFVFGGHLLSVFPWFKFMRVLSRPTVGYAPLLAMLAVAAAWSWPSKWLARAPVLAVGALALVELFTFVQLKHGAKAESFGPGFLGELKKVHDAPGEAVLDFPFCIKGGNGSPGTCPFFKLQGVYALQRFYEKKAMSHYVGRLHPKQVEPFIAQGWRKLSHADADMDVYAKRQTHCLSDAEMQFFEDFFRAGDFAGVQLALDTLGDGCAAAFERRFGAPLAHYELPVAGHLAFIPRPAGWPRGSAEAARAVRFEAPLEEQTQAVAAQTPEAFDLVNLSPYEPAGGHRWALWPATVIDFETQREGAWQLQVIGDSPLQAQRMRVVLDGQQQKVFAFRTRQMETLELPLQLSAGKHRLELNWDVGNHHPKSFAEDERALAAALRSLELKPLP